MRYDDIRRASPKPTDPYSYLTDAELCRMLRAMPEFDPSLVRALIERLENRLGDWEK